MIRPTAQEDHPAPSPGPGNGKGAKPSPLASPADDLNKQIIAMLQDDGRLPYDEIAARQEGGTPPAPAVPLTPTVNFAPGRLEQPGLTPLGCDDQSVARRGAGGVGLPLSNKA